jgi:hypothetical protein
MKFVLPLKSHVPLALRSGLGVFTLSAFGCGAKTNTENATGGAKRLPNQSRKTLSFKLLPTPGLIPRVQASLYAVLTRAE